MYGKYLRALLPSLGLFTCTLAGCGAPTNLMSSSYKISCTVATDCVTAVFGELCGCYCVNGAINKSDSAHYQADFDAALSSCHKQLACDQVCPSVSATCTAGACAAVTAAQ